MRDASKFAAPLGMSSFRDLRRAGATYVDKTASIAAVLRAPVPVVLFPRPRRFGKTLWMSTLAAWVEPGAGDGEALFGDLAIWQDEGAQAHRGRHPVVSLTFKDVKHRTWDECRNALAAVMVEAFRVHRSLLAQLAADGREQFAALLAGRADQATLEQSLKTLTGALASHHGAQVVLLIDEYDSPLHAAYVHGYYDEAITFFRNLLSAALKDNPALFRGVLTGILRVAKESIFSGLNKLIVYSMLDPTQADAFGFTESEVVSLAAQAGASGRLDEIRAWYDGYRFGGVTIFNPWSVLNFLAHQPPDPAPYWVNTASDDLIRRLLVEQGPATLAELEALVAGDAIEEAIDEHIVLREVDRRREALWSFLVFTGYLTPVALRREGTRFAARLRVPNAEVLALYRDLFRRWMDARIAPGYRVEDLLAALIAGDAEAVEWLLTGMLVEHWSYHDTGRGLGEAVYHAFVIGLLVRLADDYRVESNREAGFGRADVLITPRRPGRPGVVLELKVPRGKSAEATLADAMDQLAARRYAEELRARGAGSVVEFGIVFDGKRAWVARRFA
ncbi:MAG: AAA family ATPase [bacterium]